MKHWYNTVKLAVLRTMLTIVVRHLRIVVLVPLFTTEETLQEYHMYTRLSDRQAADTLYAAADDMSACETQLERAYDIIQDQEADNDL